MVKPSTWLWCCRYIKGAPQDAKIPEWTLALHFVDIWVMYDLQCSCKNMMMMSCPRYNFHCRESVKIVISFKPRYGYIILTSFKTICTICYFDTFSYECVLYSNISISVSYLIFDFNRLWHLIEIWHQFEISKHYLLAEIYENHFCSNYFRIPCDERTIFAIHCYYCYRK